MTISVDLGSQLETFVSDLVSKGRYGSKSEILREGVRLVQEREARFAILQAQIEEGMADVRAGRMHDAEDVFAELEAKYQAMIDEE